MQEEVTMDDIELYKHEASDIITWGSVKGFGGWFFTFDGDEWYNYYQDYPSNLNSEQKAIFDAENPILARRCNPNRTGVEYL